MERTVDANSVGVYGLGRPVRKQQRLLRLVVRPRATQAVLLGLLASGTLFNNILFFNFMDYPVTFTVLLTLILYALGLLNWLGTRASAHVSPTFPALALPALSLITYEFIVHGVLLGGIAVPQWIKSFSLLTMCAGLVVVSSRLRLSERQLLLLAKSNSLVAYLMGGLGLIQFALGLLAGREWHPLPATILLNLPYSIGFDNRFGNLIRATGISYEPSFYGVGMVVVAALCLAFLRLVPPNRRSRYFLVGALITALGGVAASASFSAWGLMAAILLGWMAGSVKLGHVPGRIKLAGTRYGRRIVLVGLVLLVLAVVGMWPYLGGRFERLLGGSDNSANARLALSIRLILLPGEDLFSSLLGTGIGLAGDSATAREALTQYVIYYGDAAPPGDSDKISLWNGFAYVAVTLGWIGLGLNMWLIATVFRKKSDLPIPTLLFLALVVVYPFSIGRYLDPDWWALLVLVSVLRRVRTQ